MPTVDSKLQIIKNSMFELIYDNATASQLTTLLENTLSAIGIRNYALFLIVHKNKEVLLTKSIEDNASIPFMYPFVYDNEEISLLRHDFTDQFKSHQEAISILKTILIFLYLDEIKKLKLDQEFLKKDLEIAAKMQGLLIPNELFSSNQFKAEGLYKPNYLIGGDYYDVISINENKIAFCIADISGKGINAAILMANFQAILRSILVREFAVEQAIDILNHKIFEITKGEKFITLFLGIYNFEDGRLVYANCGHNPIALYSENHFEWLEKGTTILGAFESLPFVEVGKMYIIKSTKIFLYTDGILNLKNRQNQYLSLLDLKDILYREYKDSSLKEVISVFDKKINEIDVEESLKDDISLLAIEINPET